MPTPSAITTCASAAWTLGELIEAKEAGQHRVSVVLPAHNEEATVGRVVTALHRALTGPGGLVDEIVVIDSFSTDRTSEVARAAGATVHHCRDVAPEVPAVAGKGEALWRSLFVTRGDLVVFIDADLEDAGPHYVTGLLGPLLTDPGVDLVKGFYDRPLLTDTGVVANGGGRVTELVARPLLNQHWPELAGLVQPLAGEYAARRALLEDLPFPVTYGVEIAMLIDVVSRIGPDAIAQVDLGRRTHRHQSPAALGIMASQVLAAALHRLDIEPRSTTMRQYRREDGATRALDSEIDVRERPPASTVEAYRRSRRLSESTGEP